MTFGEAVLKSNGSLIKARRVYMRAHRIHPDDWYLRWQAGPLANEVTRAIESFVGAAKPPQRSKSPAGR